MIFEDLEAWKMARLLVGEIYRLTREQTISRDFGLCSQVQRAAVSVMSNIAEGFERLYPAEKLQAYNVARGSAAEVRSLLYVIEDNYPESATAVSSIRGTIESTGRLVSGLINSARSRRIKNTATLLCFLVAIPVGAYFLL